MAALVVRLGEKELGVLRGLGERGDLNLPSREARVLAGLMAKLNRAAEKKAAPKVGVTVGEAEAAFQEALGQRKLIRLQAGTPGWFAAQARLKQLSATRTDCVRAASAALGWRGMIRTESLVRQLDVLVQQEENEGPVRPPSAPQGIHTMDEI